MDEEKFDELRQEFELLKEYHGKLLEAFQLLKKNRPTYPHDRKYK